MNIRLNLRLTKSLSQSSTLRVAIIATIFSGCGPVASSSSTRDIFAQDLSTTGNERRRPATPIETFWTISMGGCTGHLIAPEIMMTAAHCNARVGATYKSGSAIVQKTRSDITVTQVMEDNKGLDYSILRIRWANMKPDSQRFPSSIAFTRNSIEIAENGANQGDMLFTVGFPTDKSSTWGPTYSQGQAKEESGNLLRYNIGIINGNSGGGVWRKSDGMLVSLTNGGPNNFGQGTWSGADAEDSTHWNHGAAMWKIYAASKVIRDIFPNGKNRYSGIPDTTPSSSSTGLFVAMEQSPNSTDLDNLSLLISTTLTDAKIILCQNLDNCAAASGQQIATSEGPAIDGRRILRTMSKLNITNGAIWHVAAVDQNGKIAEKQTIRFRSK